MPRKSSKQRIQCQYFTWLIGTRKGVYYADGRGLKPDLGRHSLNTKDRDQAQEALRHLDLRTAVDHGRADANSLHQATKQLLPLDEGWTVYWEHLSRPAVMGGVSQKTLARYKAVYDKFSEFAAGHGIRYWSQVDVTALTKYGRWLDENDYSGRTMALELTTIKQTLNLLIEQKRLSASCDFPFRIHKIRATTTYCYQPREVVAMVEHCRTFLELWWLADVIVALATTGLRISELAALRWEDVNLEAGTIVLTDTTRTARRSERQAASQTKSHQPRYPPLNRELVDILKRLQRHPDGRVFHGPNGGKLKPDTVRNILRREVQKPLSERFPAGPNGKGIEAGRLHSFRHYFCSRAADSGVSENMLKSWLGHSNSDMIRLYYHMRSDEARRQIELVPFLFEPVPNLRGAIRPTP